MALLFQTLFANCFLLRLKRHLVSNSFDEIIPIVYTEWIFKLPRTAIHISYYEFIFILVYLPPLPRPSSRKHPVSNFASVIDGCENDWAGFSTIVKLRIHRDRKGLSLRMYVKLSLRFYLRVKSPTFRL